MSRRSLNLRFFLLQGLLALLECISTAYLAPILFRFGYSPARIGFVMTLAALAATLARPLWGWLNDRLACARQVTLGAAAAGVACFHLVTHSGGHLLSAALGTMGLYVTMICMTNFIDSWAMRLISTGSPLDYGVTRAGGSLFYAVGAAAFGAVAARHGFQPGNTALVLLLLPMAAVTLSLPNPPRPAAPHAITLRQGLASLTGNRTYLLMLAAFFLCTLDSSTIDSFYSVLILSLGGTEREVGIALFVQAISEVPVMMGYALIRRRLRISPAAVLAFAMFFYGVKSLVFGFAPTWNAAVGAAVLQALSFALLAPACVDFMLETVSPDYLATAHLVFIAAGQGAAAVLGNSLGGVLADLWGVSAMFRAGSLLAFLASGVALWTLRTGRRRELPGISQNRNSSGTSSK